MVEAKIRYIGKSQKRYNALSGGDGGPPELYWMFHELLSNVLREGGLGGEKDVVIKGLDIDVLSPGVEAEEGLASGERLGNEDGVTTMREVVMDPEPILQAVGGGMGILLGLYRDAKGPGELVYESLGTIRVRLDGEVVREWNVGQVLEEMDGKWWGYHKDPVSVEEQEVFRRWKEEMLERRRRVGLGGGKGER